MAAPQAPQGGKEEMRGTAGAAREGLQKLGAEGSRGKMLKGGTMRFVHVCELPEVHFASRKRPCPRERPTSIAFPKRPCPEKCRRGSPPPLFGVFREVGVLGIPWTFGGGAVGVLGMATGVFGTMGVLRAIDVFRGHGRPRGSSGDGPDASGPRTPDQLGWPSTGHGRPTGRRPSFGGRAIPPARGLAVLSWAGGAPVLGRRRACPGQAARLSTGRAGGPQIHGLSMDRQWAAPPAAHGLDIRLPAVCTSGCPRLSSRTGRLPTTGAPPAHDRCTACPRQARRPTPCRRCRRRPAGWAVVGGPAHATATGGGQPLSRPAHAG
eukprot:gene9382-biopygen4701